MSLFSSRWVRVCASTLALAFTAAAQPALAQAWPSKPVRFIVPYPPGSGTDIMARRIGQRLGERLGQSFVVDNRAGAGGSIGTEAIAKAPADGYTIGIVDAGALAINPAIYPKLGYDTQRDLVPIIEVSTLPFMLVANPSLGVNNLRELIALAKREPGRINYASVGNGSGVHLATEMLKKQAGISLTHIPYKGSAPALTDVLAGTTPLMFVNLLSGLPHVKSGKLRVLAVGAPARLAALPDVPTVAEAGLPGYEFQVWIGIVAPAGTPAAVVDRLNNEIRAALAVPEIRDQLVNEGGMQIVGNSPAQFGAHIAADLDLWRKVVKDTGAKLD